MAFYDYSNSNRGNLCKHVSKEYMYMKGASPSILLGFPLMSLAVGLMLLLGSTESPTLLPPHYALSLEFIPDYNNLKVSAMPYWLVKGMKEENHNIINGTN
jgi:hypothetical protein